MANVTANSKEDIHYMYSTLRERTGAAAFGVN
jgi:hypothetical protein